MKHWPQKRIPIIEVKGINAKQYPHFKTIFSLHGNGMVNKDGNHILRPTKNKSKTTNTIIVMIVIIVNNNSFLA
jgi:hypothetical protein